MDRLQLFVIKNDVQYWFWCMLMAKQWEDHIKSCSSCVRLIMANAEMCNDDSFWWLLLWEDDHSLINSRFYFSQLIPLQITSPAPLPACPKSSAEHVRVVNRREATLSKCKQELVRTANVRGRGLSCISISLFIASDPDMGRSPTEWSVFFESEDGGSMETNTFSDWWVISIWWVSSWGPRHWWERNACCLNQGRWHICLSYPSFWVHL